MWVIDFEASGLSKLSYPIEVGLTNGHIEYQALIRPLAHWEYWSEEAQSIHNITRNLLVEEGDFSEVVAKQLNHFLTGETVYCDSAHWDGYWCNVLFSDNAISQKFCIADVQELLAAPDASVEVFLEQKHLLEDSDEYRVHRALDDAKILWRSAQAALGRGSSA